MANSKITDLPDIGTPAATDVLYVVGTPGGTPTDKKVQIQNLRGKSVDNPSDFIVANGAASAFDYEFEGQTSSLPSGWSWVNQGTSVYTETMGAGTIVPQIASGDHWRIIVRSLSGAPSTWLATAKIQGICTNGQAYLGSIILRESSSGKFVAYSIYNINRIYVEKWTDENTYSGAASSDIIGYDYPKYLRVRKNSSSSWDFEASMNGLAWAPSDAAYNVSSFCTPDQIGFGLSATGSTSAAGSIEWLRVR